MSTQKYAAESRLSIEDTLYGLSEEQAAPFRSLLQGYEKRGARLLGYAGPLPPQSKNAQSVPGVLALRHSR